MNRLLWFRNDLRTVDQPALHHCCEDAQADHREGEVFAIYILCQEYIDRHPVGRRKLQFIRDALLNLSDELNRLGVEFEVLYVRRKKDITRKLLTYCEKHAIRAVYLNREYPLDEQRRDCDFEARCAEAAVLFNAYHDRCLVPPGSLQTKAGGYYKVFTPFARAWHQCVQATHFQIHPKPKKRAGKGRAQRLDVLFDRLATEKAEPVYPASESTALTRLHEFVHKSVEQYHKLRDFPAEAGTSVLSPYLSLGILSPKQCYLALRQAPVRQDNPGARAWLNELIWREFYMHLIATHPGISKHEPLQSYTEKVPWRDSAEDFKRWCAGQTGVPIVDAAMRQLNQTGWMHNRLRMISAMFLTKNLLIDWRPGRELLYGTAC